ncbi:MAG TPA: tRNA (adenosine(37)-N6)-threonylcarbamoyltransferase complex dimerization subunit type 1 TsaB [Roseiflexaceae bacterium]|nr:tRNA (adenosine(37)-N6)-threonylcarbamoyltransferase complex dimerization subunit type 1 TsaB [Roseiflexaceae bacterium]
MLLAIDTSTAIAGLACYEARGLVGECAWFSGRDHTAQLLPQLTLLLRHIGRAREMISALAVALGPGSWSGLRVGISTAKGLALAGGLPLVGVSTLDALAYQHAQPGVTTYPLIRLGRERYASAAYGVGDAEQHRIQPRNTTLAELCAEVSGPALFCGDIDSEVQDVLRQRLGDRARFPSPAANLRRPGFLAELAWRRLQAGEGDSVATLAPIYLGQPVKTRS